MERLLRSGGILPALDEAIRIGREAKIPVEIWHLKVAGKRNWGRMAEVIAAINKARAQGIRPGARTARRAARHTTAV